MGFVKFYWAKFEGFLGLFIVVIRIVVWFAGSYVCDVWLGLYDVV